MDLTTLTTPQELLELLRAGQPEDKQNVDPSKLKYALYARKSTQGDERQESSIEDQIKDCVDRILTPLGIVPVKVIKEQFSAKEPDTRILFMELVNDIKAGRIDGIIAWHPDRLARNMKDAGEIIDLLDKGTLRDLKFATFTFQNNPSGKMLLGMSFVLAKEYSEHLSENVTRGNRRATEDEGIFIGKYKHGYYINGNRYLIPDNNTFTLVQYMFKMRLEGASQKEICEWINQQGYKLRKRGKDPMPFTWDKDDVSKLMRDPVNAGVLKWGDHTVNIVEKYKFTPMITVEEFFKINKVNDFSAATVQSITRVKTGDIRANLLRGMIYCGACKQTLTSMVIDKKHNGQIVRGYYYYKCETPGCAMKNKAVRAKLVLDAAKEFFSTYLFVTKDNYAVYVEDARKVLKKKNIELESQIGSLKSQIGQKQQKYEQTKALLLNNPELAEHYDLASIKDEENDIRTKLVELTDQRNRSKESIATYAEYLKLLESTPVILNKIQDMEVMDALLRIFFSKFIIEPATGGTYKGSKVLYKLKNPGKGS